VEDLAALSKKSPEEITGNIFQSLGEDIVRKAREKAPVKTGTLRNSISYRVSGKELIIGPHVPYAPYMEFGTGSKSEFGGNAYEIKPKSGQYLKFQVGGKTVFTKKVMHPGIEPRPFMRPAVEEVMGELADKLADHGAMLITKGPKHAGA
jgi:HK97 gp10 family phage protein